MVERGSKIPPAATANGTTDTAVTNVTAGSDNKGGVSPSANVETNSPRQNIAQANATDKSTSTVFGSKEYAMANMTELEKKEANEIERNIAKGKKAMAEIIKNHGDIKSAMHSGDIGDIDFLWGQAGDPNRNYRKGYGIAHIIARRNIHGLDGEAVALQMPEVIMKGEKQRGFGENKIKLHYGDYTAILTNDLNGEKVLHWLLTGFKKNETEPTNERGEGFDSTAPTSRTPTPTRHTGAVSSVSEENITQTKFAGNGDLERMFATAKQLSDTELTSQEHKWVDTMSYFI